jgi:hypothetical protein
VPPAATGGVFSPHTSTTIKNEKSKTMATTIKGFQTPVLAQWMETMDDQIEQCRRDCKGDAYPARVGILEVWSGWADEELQQLRLVIDHLEGELATARAELESRRAVEAVEEDAETARRTRQAWFADAWDRDELGAGFIGRHIHE